ncbi:MAG: MlaD family protein [Candidatus Caenarcaniphilales bacterium]|nr:MlaD family protein [Candidatus Caenarcaniphilales bacterium]
MNKEAKVGALVVIFLVISLAFIVWIKGNPFRKTRTLNVLFDNVHGLSAGSPVEYAGLNAGKVSKFKVTSGGIVTEIAITEPTVKIHEGDRFLIIPSSTIASEYQIFIIPNVHPSPEVPNKSTIIGQTAPGLQDFLFSAEEALDDLKLLMKQVRGILTGVEGSLDEISPLVKLGSLSKDGTIDRFVGNLDNTARSLNEVSTTANSLLRDKSDDLRNSIDRISSISTKLDSKLDAIDSAELRSTISSLRKTAANLEAISSSVEPAEVKKDLETFSKAAEQVKIVLDKLQSDDPNEDAPTMVKRTIKRLDRISAGLESSLKRKSLFRVLTTKVQIKDSVPEASSSLSPANYKQNFINKEKGILGDPEPDNTVELVKPLKDAAESDEALESGKLNNNQKPKVLQEVGN